MTPDFIKDLETLQSAVAVNQNFTVENLTPKVSLAAKKWLMKWVGYGLYNDLKAKYNNNTATAEETIAIGYITQILANWGMYHFLAQASVQVSDGGVLRKENEESKTAFKYQENNLREDYLLTGWDWLEELTKYLYLNDFYFPLWSGTPSRNTKENIIHFAFQFNEHVKIQGGRWMFEQMRPLLKSMETFVVEANLGTDFWEEIKTQLSDDTINIANQKVIDMMQPAVAYFTQAEAILSGWAKLTPDGLVLMERDSNDTSKRTAVQSPNIVDPIVLKAREFGNRYLDKCMKYIKDNPDDYPTFNAWQTALAEEAAAIEAEENDLCGCPLTDSNPCNNNSSEFVIF